MKETHSSHNLRNMVLCAIALVWTMSYLVPFPGLVFDRQWPLSDLDGMIELQPGASAWRSVAFVDIADGHVALICEKSDYSPIDPRPVGFQMSRVMLHRSGDYNKAIPAAVHLVYIYPVAWHGFQFEQSIGGIGGGNLWEKRSRFVIGVPLWAFAATTIALSALLKFRADRRNAKIGFPVLQPAGASEKAKAVGEDN